MARKSTKRKIPTVHKELTGFRININEFGEIKTNLNIEKLNDFLNKNVFDKKLNGLEDNEPLAITSDESDEDVIFGENVAMNSTVLEAV
jgi:hypothetical protein